MAHRYFCAAPGEGRLSLTGDEAAHLSRVLRAEIGDELTVFDGRGHDYACRIDEITAQTVECAILSSEESVSEPSVAVTLYVGYPKGDKLELVIQKAVELGAAAIVPFFCSRCVTAPKKEEQKNQRYRRIAFEAAKQSGRGIVPEVALPLSFDQMLEELPRYDAAFFCYEAQKDSPSLHSRLKNVKSAAIITGPEGGFSEEEARRAGLVADGISLGPRILRCETAPIAALSAVMAFTGNLE